MDSQPKCACPKCNCPIKPGEEVRRDGKLYCCQACARDCTATTCVCVHEHCEHEHTK